MQVDASRRGHAPAYRQQQAAPARRASAPRSPARVCVRHLPGPKTGPAGFVFVGVCLETLSNYNVPFPDTLVEH